jgi:hypothetical protein
LGWVREKGSGFKEISRKEATSFNAATVAAVGWALPTLGETLFEKLPQDNFGSENTEVFC